MTRYTREDVETHREGYSRNALPAVNVKAYTVPTVWQVVHKFNCEEKLAEQALGYAFESAQGMFWEQASEDVAEYFPGYSVEAFSEGRSGGWLVVRGLPDVETWDAILLSRWRKFERETRAQVVYLCSWESFSESIEANRWTEEGAELFNFFERKDGTSVCVAEANRAAEAAYKATLHADERAE